jgi:hypothetical protein
MTWFTVFVFYLKAERKKERNKERKKEKKKERKIYFLKTTYNVNTCTCFRFNCITDG